MNGVRRFLGAATSPPASAVPPEPLQIAQTPPLSFSAKANPSWPPQSPIHAQLPPPPTETPALFVRKDRQKPQPPPPPPEDDPPNASPRSTRSSIMSPSRSQHSHPSSSSIRLPAGGSTSGPSSPRVSPPTRVVTRKSVPPPPEWKRSSGLLNTRDELLISLLASEAVVDSRDFEILSSEEVDDLKKEQQILTSRLGAMGKKLTLETKIRDAAVSLTRVNSSNKKISKQTDEQLEAANRRVESAQKELWRISERNNEVQRRLLEHRAGVLSFSVRSMEKKMAPNNTDGDDSGYNTSNRSTLMSPASSSMTGVSSSSKTRFDGAHLFAGHADAVIPRRNLSPEAAAIEIALLEEKLKAAAESLTAAGKKQADMARELSLMRLEKEEVETMMGMELQSAEDTITALEKELPRLEGLDSELQELLAEKDIWIKERIQLEERNLQVDALQQRLAVLEGSSGEAAGVTKLLEEVQESSHRQLEQKDAEIQNLKSQWEADRAAWEKERTRTEEDKIEDMVRLQDEMDRLRDDDEVALQKMHQEVDDGLAALQTLIQHYGIVLYSQDSSLQGLLESVGAHLEEIHSKMESHERAEQEWEAVRRKLEEDVRSGMDKREALARELEEARRGMEQARRDVGSLETRVREASMPASPPPTSMSSVSMASMLSEISGDEAKIISILQPIWAVLPSPEARAAKFNNQRQFRTGSPNTSTSPGAGTGITSLSDLDVRSLKSLYDNRMPNVTSPTQSTFTIEAFAARVQALIADDRALIERLVRFAQAHDLLKKNAERAQKLAHEGNSALETYQKQVRTLEERNMSLSARQAAVQDEIQYLQDSIDRITAEKRDVEMHAAEQAETCRQLTEANNTLSARTLTLAEEAASAPEMVRKQLESQLSECRSALEAAQNEVNAMRTSEQSQKIALLDELNSMQTENGALRAQLRAAKK